MYQGVNYRAVANQFGAAVPTVCCIVRETTEAIVAFMTPKYIRFPVTDVECLAAMATFNDQPIPNCVGTIDGSHIRIIRPHNYSTDYYNFKGYYSVLLQAVCDGNCKFLSLSCGHPRSIHDATMMRRSGFTGKSLQRCKLMF